VVSAVSVRARALAGGARLMVDWMDRRSWVCRWGLMTIPAMVVVESNFHACGS